VNGALVTVILTAPTVPGVTAPVVAFVVASKSKKSIGLLAGT